MGFRNRLLRRLSSFAALLGAGACGPGTTGLPDVPASIPGTYFLTTIDGQPLPARLGVEGNCTRTLLLGELSIGAGANDALPDYFWSVAAISSCSLLAPYTGGNATDDGVWSGSELGLKFQSRKARGSYPGTIVIGQAATSMAFSQDGHAYLFLRRDPSLAKGILALDVVDQFGDAVANVGLSIRTADGLQTGQISDSKRTVAADGPAGSWLILILPPNGYDVPPTQANPASAAVSANTTTKITLTIRKIP